MMSVGRVVIATVLAVCILPSIFALRVNIKTCNKLWAGTDSPVYITLRGTRASKRTIFTDRRLFEMNSKHSFDFGNLGYVTNAEISIGQRAVKGWWGKTHRYYDHWCLAEVSGPNFSWKSSGYWFTSNRVLKISFKVNGGWSDWSYVRGSGCSVSCGRGTRRQYRVCNNPAPINGGARCGGPSTRMIYCIMPACPVHGGWSVWYSKPCSASCGEGRITKHRLCNNPPPSRGGATCTGPSIATVSCKLRPCPVNGGWSEWAKGTCSATCGTGSMQKTRACNNPAPAHGGTQCDGSTTAFASCDTNKECPINGSWGEWKIGACSVTCGHGSRQSTRACDSPAPAHGGSGCHGDETKTESCDAAVQCPVNGGWGDWVQGACSVTCGHGSRQSTRACDSPAPAHGGSGCHGDETKTESCDAGLQCPVAGGWGEWSEFDVCSEECGWGNWTRSRKCDNPPPQHGGAQCNGHSSEHNGKKCKIRDCTWNSDIRNLTTKECNFFQCKVSKVCFTNAELCDGQHACTLGEDEPAVCTGVATADADKVCKNGDVTKALVRAEVGFGPDAKKECKKRIRGE